MTEDPDRILGQLPARLREARRARGLSLDAVAKLSGVSRSMVSQIERGESSRTIATPTLTAGIRGTGVYTEVMPDQRTYFCNCYGIVDVATRGERTLSESSYHQSFWGEVDPKGGRVITPADAINHTDEELEFLARLIDQRTAWQIAGKKGVKNGKGYMEDKPGQMHPAMMPPAR